MDNIMDLFRELVPLNEEGISITAQDSRTGKTEKEAADLYHAAKRRLLDINNWYRLNGKIGAGFQLFDPDREEVSTPLPGCYIRIEIPGPGNPAGDGYDWVIIEAIRDYPDAPLTGVGIRVRPAARPGASRQEVAHFYSPQSTSTFVVYKSGVQVRAIILDRNTKINTRSRSLWNRIRNFFVGAGAITAFSKIQWKFLTEGLLQTA